MNDKILEGSKCLASLAVFRELYDSEKDVYGIISEFLQEVILSGAKHSFNLIEITNDLNSTYDFNIPEAVVRTALNRLHYLTIEHGTYMASNLSELKSPKLNEKKAEIQSNNETIINNLFSFVEEETGNLLDERDKEKFVHSFCSFLLDNTTGNEHSQYISSFILKNQKSVEFKNQLSKIKEGVVLYSGIKYNSDLNDIGSWRTDLTIFVETEILFHFVGYNGELHEVLFDEFFSFIKEINRKHPNRIKLKYFSEVKGEVERFFKKAEYIVEGRDKSNPKVTAMTSIVNGCNSKSDVIMKKVGFYQLLEANGIKEDDYTYYFSEKNHKYNIEDQSVIEKVTQSLEVDDITEHLKFLNFISIHRKEANENNFDNIGFILLSGNSTTLQVAWHKEVKKTGNVPLATTLSFLTNKFWFKLNKGFGRSNFPKTFDIITKAQLLLSTALNESVGKKYDELQYKFQKGQLTEDQAKATIVELRKQVRKPEEIDEEDISSILYSISEDSIEKFIKEQEHVKNKAREAAEENTRLKKGLTERENQLKEKEKAQIELIRKVLETKENLLKEKQKSIGIIENQKSPIDAEVQKSHSFYKIKLGAFVVLLYIISYALIWKFDWEVIEQWTWIISVTIPIISSLLYMLIKEKEINPIEFLKNKRNDIEVKKYLQFNIDIILLKQLRKEEKILIKEIEEFKKPVANNV